MVGGALLISPRTNPATIFHHLPSHSPRAFHPRPHSYPAEFSTIFLHIRNLLRTHALTTGIPTSPSAKLAAGLLFAASFLLCRVVPLPLGGYRAVVGGARSWLGDEVAGGIFAEVGRIFPRTTARVVWTFMRMIPDQ